ncbi:hypothetical protein CC80DRAFT_281219 [Byssothecium circinans]|uniref:Uncharacterized protein n=1 Tax=Byssothecium circinans TaxID=147558 RepID=A0A6A5TA25_9PLEO|nr:hypothetical protein CC80DRAFT_281219 [Byssothecium circinans]
MHAEVAGDNMRGSNVIIFDPLLLPVLLPWYRTCRIRKHLQMLAAVITTSRTGPSLVLWRPELCLLTEYALLHLLHDPPCPSAGEILAVIQQAEPSQAS